MIKQKLGLVLSTAALIAATGSVHAESKYIKDIWNVSLYTEANSASQSLGLLSSGTQLEILGAEGNFTQVKTSTGEIGWTKTTYLVSQPTNDIKLKAAERKIQTLNKKIEMLSSDNASVELQAKLDKATEDHQKLHTEYTQQKQTLKELLAKAQPEAAISQRREMIIRIATIGLAALICGFIVGKRLTEAKVKSRFNGMKVW